MTTQTNFHWTILKHVSNKRKTFEDFKAEDISKLNVENCLELRRYSQAQNKIDNQSFGLIQVMKNFISFAESEVKFDSGEFGVFNGKQMLQYICWFYDGKMSQLNFTWLLNLIYTPEKIDVKHGYILRNNNRLLKPKLFKDQPKLKEYFIHDYGHDIYPFDSYNRDQIIEDLITVYKQ